MGAGLHYLVLITFDRVHDICCDCRASDAIGISKLTARRTDELDAGFRACAGLAKALGQSRAEAGMALRLLTCFGPSSAEIPPDTTALACNASKVSK